MQKLEKRVLFNNSFKNSDSLSESLNHFDRCVGSFSRPDFYIYLHTLKRSTRITCLNGCSKVVLTVSTGMEFRKSNRKGVFSALQLFRLFLKKFKRLKLYKKKIVLCTKGFGYSKRRVLKLFTKNPFRNKVVYLLDLNNKSFGGCRLKKSRRL